MSSYSRRRSGRQEINVWPGWVDALSSLVMVIFFLLMVFVVAQFYMATALSGRDEQLAALQLKMSELNEALRLEREGGGDLRRQVVRLNDELQTTTAARKEAGTSLVQLQDESAALKKALEEARRSVKADRETVELKLRELASLQADILALREVRTRLEAQLAEAVASQRQTDEQRRKALDELGAVRDRSRELEGRLAKADERTMLAQRDIDARDIRLRELTAAQEAARAALAAEQATLAEARAEVARLNQQIVDLRDQLTRIAAALDFSERAGKQQKSEIADLGSRLNQALATKVEELGRYRSEFFGRVRETLGQRQDIRVVGDRFIFQSEVLFPTASAALQDAGKQRLATLALTILDIARTIPRDISWVLRIDGHTDARPVHGRFASNWELSTARALSVVKFLIEQGVPPERLAAAGFGEFQPLEPGDSEDAMNRNRRIELRFDQH
jgi:chemotaxis protein MotB